MVNYVDHISDVQQHLHKCPDPVAIKALNDTIIDIRKETRLWKEVLPEISLSEGVNQYLIRLDVDRPSVRIRGVTGVLHGGDDLIATKYRTVRRRVGGDYGNSRPTHFAQLKADEIFITPTPDETSADDGIEVFVYLLPTVGAHSVDDDIFFKVRDAAIHGSLQRLLTMPRMHWTNRTASEYYADQYRFKKATLRVESELTEATIDLVADVSVGAALWA